MANDDPKSKFEHVVHLMLENRSFDHMLGYLKPAGPDFIGLLGLLKAPSNKAKIDGEEVTWPAFQISAPTTDELYHWPGVDPGEGYVHYDTQIFGKDHLAGSPPDASGYLADFAEVVAADKARKPPRGRSYTLPENIMGGYLPAALPVLSALANGFAVCDEWYCSAPAHTWPNRAFAAAATSQGEVDNIVQYGWMTARTIFNAMTDDMGKKSWAIYYDGSHSHTRSNFAALHEKKFKDNFQPLGTFENLAKTGKLPCYSFIEPDFSRTGNSQHPDHDVAKGEQLIYDVYCALYNGPAWNKTLLIVTYDEHGGLYDHHAPKGKATPPGDGKNIAHDFDFTRFGPRVPAVLVSPWIPPATVFRAPTDKTKQKTIDHTSVIRTLYDRFDDNPKPHYLTPRVADAPSLIGVLTLPAPRTDNPLNGVTPPASSPPPPGVDLTVPSALDMIEARMIAQLPILRPDGTVETAAPVLPTTSDALNAFMVDRLAAHERYQDSLPAKDGSGT